MTKLGQGVRSKGSPPYNVYNTFPGILQTPWEPRAGAQQERIQVGGGALRPYPPGSKIFTQIVRKN